MKFKYLLNKYNLAFSLIEISVVLIIISFIVGGITVGSNLVRQSYLKAVISEFNSIQTAINNFYTTYNALPGDFAYAGNLWSSNAACPNSVAPVGCNGNGDGIINFNGPTGSETFRSWQHLSLAGMVNGIFTGTKTEIYQYPSKYPQGIYTLRYSDPWAHGPADNLIEFGKWMGQVATGGLLLPIEAYSIDLKIDDGYANSGILYGNDGDSITTGYCSYNYGGTITPSYNLTGVGSNLQSCRMQKVINN
jgi:hypothetical protein